MKTCQENRPRDTFFVAYFGDGFIYCGEGWTRGGREDAGTGPDISEGGARILGQGVDEGPDGAKASGDETGHGEQRRKGMVLG
ncbi:MAG: hypothetical protein K6F51_08850 [Acetatifactor sp.]|nr:hypothetical protein [Acetatifactor sp.]